MAVVRIPTPLRPLAGGRDEVRVEGRTVREALENLERECRGLRDRICEPGGEPRRFVNLFVNEEDMRHLRGLDSEVREGDVISIIPAIAGGTSAARKEQE